MALSRAPPSDTLPPAKARSCSSITASASPSRPSAGCAHDMYATLSMTAACSQSVACAACACALLCMRWLVLMRLHVPLAPRVVGGGPPLEMPMRARSGSGEDTSEKLTTKRSDCCADDMLLRA